MTRILILAAATALLAACGAQSETPPKNVAKTLSAEQQADVRALIAQTLKDDPQILQDALEALRDHEQAEQMKQLASDQRDFSIGPANAPVTIINFFDYNCPNCHAAVGWVFDAVKRNPGKVRVVFKEYPILAESSIEAAQAATAAMKQGKYAQFHQGLMSFKGRIDSAAIDQVAREAGVNVARMRRDMEDKAILDHLQRNHELANEAGLEGGVPAFVINGALSRGWGPAGEAEANRLLREAINASKQTGQRT
jgi:protein-disulfide isomerase